MATFFNQATLNIGSTSLNSNVTVGEIVAGLTLTKTAASSAYTTGEGITYIVTLTNGGTTDVTGVTLTDDLGAYVPTGSTVSVIPLTYVDGSLLYYVNGVLTPSPTVTAGDTLLIDGITVPAGGSTVLVYEATANGSAPLEAGSTITNTVTLGGTEPLSDTATVPVRESVALSIAKALCPAVITDNGELTYTFIVQNTGNLAVDATEGLTITDTFTPALTDITVTLNGEPLAEGTGYTYNPATGEFATVNGAINLPAATYTRDPATGRVTANPGFAVVTVSGRV